MPPRMPWRLWTQVPNGGGLEGAVLKEDSDGEGGEKTLNVSQVFSPKIFHNDGDNHVRVLQCRCQWHKCSTSWVAVVNIALSQISLGLINA